MAADTGTLILDVDGNLKPLKGRLAKVAKSYKMKLDDKAFTQPLGRITGKLGEFDKSLDASNARVVAFGASAGAIYAVQKALTETVRAAINVEKTLADINVILGVSNKSLAQFSDRLFKIAGSTGQAFQSVAEAATELARQGLSTEQTLKRTNDALVLTRLSGMKAAESVETLTAAINSFSKSALTSTEIINKMANVDAAFAVSTNDLAEALRRVGSTASDANVSFDELVAAVTSAQQVTARGGAVIGNSFKTIFTRLQRPQVLRQLEMLGIATKDLAGETKPVIQILQALAKQYDKLGSSQKSQITELIGGVFQINVVKAALSDLGKEYSIYDRALQTSLSSTDEAIKRNEKLNETLSALINKTFANLQKSAAGIGEGIFGPSMRGFLDTLNKVLEGGAGGEGEDIGSKIGKSIFKGLENVISGPGLMLAFAALTKIIGRLGATTGDAFKTLVLQTKESKKREGFERAVETRLRSQSGLMKDILSGERSVRDAHRIIADQIRQENTDLDIQKKKIQEISTLLRESRALKFSETSETIVLAGGKKGKGRKAGGLVPDMQERKLARQGGYTAGLTKTTNIGPGQSVISNTRETEKRFPGMKQKAIMPPPGSRASEDYRMRFMQEHGFDPYASSGIVPSTRLKFKRKGNYFNMSGSVKNILGMHGRHQGLQSSFYKKAQANYPGENNRSRLEDDDIFTSRVRVKGMDSKGWRDLEIRANKFLGSKDPAGGKRGWMKTATGSVRRKHYPVDIGESSKAGITMGDAKRYAGTGKSGLLYGKNFFKATIAKHLRGSLMMGKPYVDRELRESETGKSSRDVVGLGNYFLATDPETLIPSTQKRRIKGGKTQKQFLSRSAGRRATGFIPQFASKSDSELSVIIRNKLQAGNIQGFNNETYKRIIASDPTLSGMYQTVVSTKRQAAAAKQAGIASRRAAAAAQPRLSTIFLKNLNQVDTRKSAIAGYGFSSQMPNAKRNFQNSFRGRYPKMVKGIGYDMFKTIPGATPLSTRKMMSQFNVHALDPAAQGQVSGRVFESFIKAMSTQVRPGRETGKERIDMSRHQLRSRYRGLFTGGPASKLGHFGSEIRYGGLTSRKAMQKQGFAGGFVPNFSAVGRAMETERMMGGDPEFREWPFPHVADKSRQKDFKAVLRDHPNLAADSRKSKEKQKSMFGAGGFIPNYVVGGLLAGAGRMGMGALRGFGGGIKTSFSMKGGGGSDAAMGKMIGLQMLIPQVTGMMQGFAGEGNKATGALASVTNTASSMAVANATLEGKVKIAANTVALISGVADVIGVLNDNSIELSKETERLTEALTNQINASQQYLTINEQLTEELAKPQADQQKITKLNERLVQTMSSLDTALQAELLAAQDATEVRAVLEKSNAELAEATKQAARIQNLEGLRKKTTLFGLDVGLGSLTDKEMKAGDFANEFVGKGLGKLSTKQRDKLLDDIKKGSAPLDGSREEIVKYLTDTIKLSDEYADKLPENAKMLRLVIQAIEKEAKAENDKRDRTSALQAATKKYTDAITQQNKAIKNAQASLEAFNEELLTLSANVFSQKSFLAKFRGDVEAGNRRVGLSAAKNRLETMRPFTGERSMMRGQFMLDRAGQQEDTFGRIRKLNEDNNKQLNDIFKKMGRSALDAQTTGGMPVTQQAKQKLANYQLGLGNLASSGMRGEALSNAIDKLNNSFFGSRDQVPPGMTALKSELVDSDIKSRQELAIIAKESEEQRRILEDSYRTQLKQKQIQENLAMGGGAQSWLQGGGAGMTEMAKRMRIMRFAGRTGNVELGGRMALGLNQNIEQLTGRKTTFGRGLAIRGRQIGLNRDLSLAGAALGGGAGRFLLGQRGRTGLAAQQQIDSMMQPERGLGSIQQATKASEMQMKSMGPVLKTAFTQAMNGVGLTQTLQRLSQTMASMNAINSFIARGRKNIGGWKAEIAAEGRRRSGGNAQGYIPNFAGVMMNDQEKLVKGFREKMAVMGSGAYSLAQKRNAKPKMSYGFNPYRDAILNPGMMAGGYVPNFYSKYNLPTNMSLSQLMNEMTLAKENRGGGATRGYRNELARRYKAARLGARHFGGQLSGSRTNAYANIWNQDRWVNRTGVSPQRGNMLRSARAAGLATDARMYERIRREGMQHAARESGWQQRGPRTEAYYRSQGVQTRSLTNRMGRGIGMRLAGVSHGISQRGFMGMGGSIKAKRLALMRAEQYKQQMNLGGRLKDLYRQGKISPKDYYKQAMRIQKLGQGSINAAKYGRYAAGAGRFAMGAGRFAVGAVGGTGLAILGGGDLIGKGLGMGMEHLVGRKLSEDDKTVFGGGWDTATQVVGLSNILRAGKATGGFFGADWYRRGDDKDLRTKTTDRMMKRLGGKDSPAYKEYLRRLKKNLASEKADPKTWWGAKVGAANGYIPNFAIGKNHSLSSLFGGFSKGVQQRQMAQAMDIQKWGRPGLGHMFKPQFINAAMNTPGFKGDILRGMGGGEHFRSYPKTGSFYAGGYVPNFYGGVAASQARERRQSGRNDVYTKMINGFGLATFNGSERGMEEAIVRNHPNPRNAGMANGHVPNFAGLEKNIKSMTENLGLLNETMTMSGDGSASSAQSGGNLSVSMAPMNVSINGGGGDGFSESLTAQLDEFRRMVGETFSSMGVTPLTGPPA